MGEADGNMNARSGRTLVILGAISYVWPLVDDPPLNLDQLLGIRTGHLVMEGILHLLTLVFFSLTILTALKGTPLPLNKGARVFILAGLSYFVLYIDDFGVGVPIIKVLRDPPWYFALEAVSVLLSVLALWLAAREAKTLA